MSNVTRVEVSFKADPTGREEVPALTIHFMTGVPDYNSLEESREVYAAEAKRLTDAMWRTLPGGLATALTVEFLRRVGTSGLRVTTPT